jgi:hypothetical protein
MLAEPWDKLKAFSNIVSTPPSWTQLGVWLTSSTSRVIYTFPIAGYVVLYSDYFQKLFHFSALTESWGFISFPTRINLIYYGSLLLLGALIIWWFVSPPLLRGKRDLQHFVSDIVVARDRSTVLTITKSEPFVADETEVVRRLSKTDVDSFKEASGIIRSRGQPLGTGAGEYEHSIPTVLGAYFKWHDNKRPILRSFVAALALAGYILVLLPSLDLFLRVLGTHYHHFFS